MHVLCTGFLGDPGQLLLTPQPIADLGGDAVHLVPGGFGHWGVLQGTDLQSRTGSRATPDSQLAADVRLAAFGWEHAVLLLEDGSVVTCTFPLPAVNSNCEDAPASARTENLSIPAKAIAVAAGEQHSLAATTTGDLYAWGSNLSGQLGCDSGAACQQPQRVTLPPRLQEPQLRHSITQVACGARHSCAVTEDGVLFCWGWNLHGQCGVGAVADRVPRPQLVPMPLQLRCKQVAAGLGHTVACFVDGSAYAWGLNNDGQLGLGHDSSCTSPRLVDAAALEELDVVKVTGCLLCTGPLHMVMVACGARHTVVATACGKAFSTGWGKYGQLGLGDAGSRDVPDQIVPVLGQSIHDVACGWWSTMLLVE